MATTYPYANSTGALVSTINQLRKVFPTQVTADTLQKWGFAPKNEQYVLNTLRFLAVIDDDGNKIPSAGKLFVQGDEKFAEGLADILRDKYQDLFDLHGDAAWALGKAQLMTFFRTADETSSTVGGRQAATFQTMAGLAGHGEVPKGATPTSTSSPVQKKRLVKKEAGSTAKGVHTSPASTAGSVEALDSKLVGLTIRIELNLPATTDQKVYDSIFQSVRKNLING